MTYSLQICSDWGAVAFGKVKVGWKGGNWESKGNYKGKGKWERGRERIKKEVDNWKWREREGEGDGEV